MKKPVLVASLVACLVACGGGDDDDIPAPSDTPPSTIALTMPVTLSPGEPLPIAWTVTDAGPNDRVVLELFGPGLPLKPTSAGYHFTGTTPASIFLGTIAPDGTVMPAILPVSAPAASGQVSIQGATAGDWSIGALLVREDETVAIDTATTWVAASGIRMDLARTWAGGDDQVRARLRVKAPAEPHRLSAWLTMPDGTVASLPGIVDEYMPVAEGTVPDDILVLDQPLGVYGSGRYLVTAKLETLDGQERGSAGAVIQVCNEPGTITGAVEGGAGFDVHAIDFDAERTAFGTVAADGTFSLEVPAGAWMLESAGAAATLEVGCGRVSTVSLVAKPSSRHPAAAPEKPLRHGDTDTPDPNAVRIMVMPVLNTSVNQSEVTQMADYLAAAIRTNYYSSHLYANTIAALAQALGFGALQMQVGVERPLNVTRALTANFIVNFEVTRRSPTGFYVHMALADARDGRLVGQAIFGETPGEIDEVTDVIDRNLSRLIGDPDTLRSRRDSTENPIVQTTFGTQTVEPGATLEGLITVLERDGRRVANVNLETSITTIPAGLPVTSSLTTDGEGQARVTYAVPMMNPPAFVLLTPSIVRGNGTKVPMSGATVTVRPARSVVAVGKPILRTNGDRTTVSINMAGQGGRTFTVTATAVRIKGPSEVRLDSAGRGRVDIETDERSGPAEVKVQFIAEVAHAAPAGPAVAHAYVVKPLDLTAFVEPRSKAISGQILEVRGGVTSEGVPLPGMPVALQVIGEGQTTGSTISDANGAYSVYWRAPATGTGSTMIKLTVVKDADVVERVVTVTYEPPCMNCPLLIENPATVARGGQALFLANQGVTWSASRGSITSDGLFTAPNLGGTARITATSVANPQITKTVAITEECRHNEVVTPIAIAAIVGDVTPGFIWSDRVLQSCTTVRVKLIDQGPGSALVAEHRQDCQGGAGLGGTLTPVGANLQNCTIAFSEVGPCGILSQLVLAPDPNSDGMSKRAYQGFLAHQPTNGVGLCVPDYGAQGVLGP